MMKNVLENASRIKAAGGKDKPRGIFRMEDGSICYENADGKRYKMLPDGSWIFDGKQK